MFGGEPQHLHVGVGKVRPPFRLDWVSGGTSLDRVPAGDRLPLPLLRDPQREPDRRLDEERAPALDHPRGPLRGGRAGRQPARPRLRLRDVPQQGAVRERLRDEGRRRGPRGCGRARAHRPLDASISARPRRRRSSSATGSTSATTTGSSTACAASTARRVWTFRAGGAVKGAIAYDRGRVFFGAYDGRLYALRASDGKLLWRAQSDRDCSAGTASSTRLRAVAYSRVYLGSTDGHVYSYGEQSGKLRWSYKTGGFVYGSPAVWHGRVFVGSYDHMFYAFNAATGAVLWKFHGQRPDLGLRDRRRRHRLLRHAQATHVRARRPDREAGVDVPRRRFHARGDRRAPALRRRLGQGLRVQPSKVGCTPRVRGDT